MCIRPPRALVEDDGLLREANKPQIANSISSLIGPDAALLSNVSYVLDGGSLLKSVPY